MKAKLNSGSACDHLVQNILFSYLLSKTSKIKITYEIVVMNVGVKIDLCLRGKRTDLGPWRTRSWEEYLVRRRRKQQEAGLYSVAKSLTIC